MKAFPENLESCVHVERKQDAELNVLLVNIKYFENSSATLDNNTEKRVVKLRTAFSGVKVEISEYCELGLRKADSQQPNQPRTRHCAVHSQSECTI